MKYASARVWLFIANHGDINQTVERSTKITKSHWCGKNVFSRHLRSYFNAVDDLRVTGVQCWVHEVGGERRLPHIRKEPRMVEHSNGSSGGFGSSMLVHGFQSHGGTPNHPVVMDDHDFAGLVLKPVLTQEPPILNSSRNPLILPFCPSH